MNKQLFQQELIGVLEERFPDMTFKITQVERIGGTSYEAITATVKGSRIGMNLNFDNIFRVIEHGASFEDVANATIRCVEYNLSNAPDIPYKQIGDYDWVKRRLHLELVSADSNQQRIGRVPHKTCGDMYLICRAIIGEDGDRYATVVITNEMLRVYGISEEQLFEDAYTYAPQNDLAVFRNMGEVMYELTKKEALKDYQMEMWVATTETTNRGAAVIFYPNFLNHVGQMLGGDFVIIPSSIHECLVIPKRHLNSLGDIEGVMKIINEEEVKEEDRLSWTAYWYDTENRVIRKYVDRSSVVWRF